MAEESDLIVDLDRFVLRRAAEDCAQWRARPGFETMHVAVNVSARHIAAPQFVEHVFDVLVVQGYLTGRPVPLAEIVAAFGIDQPVAPVEGARS